MYKLRYKTEWPLNDNLYKDRHSHFVVLSDDPFQDITPYASNTEANREIAIKTKSHKKRALEWGLATGGREEKRVCPTWIDLDEWHRGGIRF